MLRKFKKYVKNDILTNNPMQIGKVGSKKSITYTDTADMRILVVHPKAGPMAEWDLKRAKYPIFLSHIRCNSRYVLCYHGSDTEYVKRTVSTLI